MKRIFLHKLNQIFFMILVRMISQGKFFQKSGDFIVMQINVMQICKNSL